MDRQQIFSKTVEFKEGLTVTVSAGKDGICGISVGICEKSGAVPNAKKIPPEALGCLDSTLSRISSYFGGENRPLYKWEENKPEDSHTVRLVFPPASDFRLKVWEETSKIPYGKTLTYSELARKVGGTNHRRAVAQALSANVFPILIPCHRVVGAKGAGGYSSGGVEVKRKLLAMESGDED